MSNRHTVTLHDIISLSNDMNDNMDGIIRWLAKKMTQSKEHLYFTVKIVRQNVSK